MRALRLSAWQHDPEFQDMPEPEPEAGQVLVRVGGAGACHSDLHLFKDFSSGMLPFEPPFTLGHENAGWIEALGEGEHGFDIGQPVAVYGSWGCGRCRHCQMGMENYCERQADIGVMGGGLGLDGGMAPYMIVPSGRYLVPLHGLDPVDAAPLTDAGLTPYHAVKRSLALLVPGTSAVVIGVGGLGHMGVQLLRELTPATIIAVDQRPEALSLATDVGAARGVPMASDAAAHVLDATHGHGADVVLDFVGSDETMALAAHVARQLSHVTVVGLAGGTLPVSFFGIAYEASVATSYWGTLPELCEVLALAEAGRIKAEIATFPLTRALDAYAALRDGKVAGRAVIVP